MVWMASVLGRLLLCAGVAWAMSRTLGPALALVFTAPLLGLALRRPILDLLAGAVAKGKELALADVEGRFHAFRGIPIDVVHDEDERPWVLVHDVRKVLPGLPRDAVLQQMLRERVGEVPGWAGLRIRADALEQQLRAATDPQAIRFKEWLGRDVLRLRSATRTIPGQLRR